MRGEKDTRSDNINIQTNIFSLDSGVRNRSLPSLAPLSLPFLSFSPSLCRQSASDQRGKSRGVVAFSPLVVVVVVDLCAYNRRRCAWARHIETETTTETATEDRTI